MKNDYGSRSWLEGHYAVNPDSDPWGLDWRPTQQLRYRRMLDSLQHGVGDGWRPSCIVDLGCATGNFTSQLGRLPGAAAGCVVGIDVAQLAIDRARARHPALQFERASIAEAADRFAGSVDLVTCLEVLYYLPQSERVSTLVRLRDMLKPGGLLLASSMIGRPPYLDARALQDLVGAELEIVDSGTLYLRPFVLLEKSAMKLGRLFPRAALARRQSRLGSESSILARLERLAGAGLPGLARSHAFVLGRRV